ncbi:RHS repeat-associated core domain-containing protein, partial [Hafnia alvei]
ERSAHRHTDYHLDLAGNRLINRYMPEAFMADMRHPGNRLSEDTHYYYQYDQYGNLSQKTRKRDAGEVHHYRYDRSHRLVSYLCAQDGEALRGGRYCYDPLGRRIGKQVMQRNQPKHISWFGWDGDKLVLTERDGTRIHTVYLPHSFVPLLRFEGDKPPTVTPLADKLEQEVGITLPPDFKQTLHHIELALRANRLSEEQHAWLNQVQLSPDYLATLLDPLPDTPYAAQLYDCNHLGTPQQLINLNGDIDWSITLDAWGNALSEENPHQLHQPIRMQGQQYDEESGLHYNRHRYYDPTIGRYITQDPIGLRGGLNPYTYPLNPIMNIDPKGLCLEDACVLEGAAVYSLWQWLVVGSAGVVIVASNNKETKALNEKLQQTKTENLANCEEKKLCPPCKTISGNIVPRGTIGYRHDLVPPGKPHHPYTGDHYNLYKANQNPNNCQCFWKESGAADAANGFPPPAGSIPIEPFVS